MKPTKVLLATRASALAEHPVFPEEWLRARGIVADALLNWTLQTKETHAALEDVEPEAVARRLDLVSEAVRSQDADLDAMAENNWGTFAERRARALREHLETLLRAIR